MTLAHQPGTYRLGRIDQSFVPKEVAVTQVAICAGEADVELLSRAFALLCGRYPMLGGRIEFHDGDYHLSVPERGCGNAVVEILDSPVADWLDNGLRTIDPALSLAKLEIVRDGATTAVALRVAHAIADAHMGFALLEEFWRAAAALGATGPVPDPVPVFPRSLEDLLDERGVVVPEPALPELSGLYSLTPTETAGRPGLRLAAGERIQLSARDTGALLRYARSQGTTMHALLSAAIIRAERRLIGETRGAATISELPMIIGHAVDLRPHLRPPAVPAEATNGLGFAPTVTLCAPGTDLLTLGKEIKAQIVHGIASGAALSTMFAAVQLPDDGARAHTVNIITNWGVVPDLESPKGLRITDFRGFATGNSRPENSYFLYTFHGRLSIEFTFSEDHHHRSRIIALRDAIAENLDLLIDATGIRRRYS
ncbi:hypothetical protein H0264_28470 [Nocardia huaxiensis]|uniref:Phthiocerol/phthiodiolone dimycocerosyl transferase n=1 Tax=Nocardia huaxiensis TaxID=2755382 RepID=A0A7D6VCR3_9NOCA|nr:hypothetical protein [Nocardia huaxiensis]QLY29195.1 hypothetical protein H0264_28470 [Nocardia huaxiensis]